MSTQDKLNFNAGDFMNISDVTSFIQTLGSLAAMASTYYAYKQEGRVVGEFEKQSILKEGEKEKRIEPSFHLSESVMSIPEPIFEAIKARLKSAESLYTKILRSPNTKAVEFETEYKKVQEVICECISLLKRHNQNILPTDEKIILYWKSFDCTSFFSM